MPEKRTKYDREFREGAVRIVNEIINKPIAQVARDLEAGPRPTRPHPTPTESTLTCDQNQLGGFQRAFAAWVTSGRQTSGRVGSAGDGHCSGAAVVPR